MFGVGEKRVVSKFVKYTKPSDLVESMEDPAKNFVLRID